MPWYKRIIKKYGREIVISAIISVVVTVLFSLWYFITGKPFEWQSISPISQPDFLSREFYGAIAFSTIGAFLYYVVKLWKILKFICVDILDDWKLYIGVKAIVWAILVLWTQFYLVPTVVDWLNAVLSFFYNTWRFILYACPPVGILLAAFGLAVGVQKLLNRKE